MKNSSKILAITLITIIIISYTNIVIATEKTELKNKQSDLNNSISEAKEELEDIKVQKSATMSQVQNLITQIGDYEEEIEDLNSKITNLENKIDQDEKQIKEDEIEYEKQLKALKERLVAMYENGEISYLDVLLSSTSLTDFISSYYMVSEITSYDTKMLNKVEEERKKIEAEKQQLEENKKTLDNSKETKEAKAAALKVAKKDKEEKVSELTEEEKVTQKEIEEMQATRIEIDNKLKKIAEEEARKAAEEAARKKAEEEARKKAAASANSNSSSKTKNSSTEIITSNISPSSSGYIFPVQGLSKANIRTKTYPSYAGHTGVDININVTGRNVVAVKDGTVVTSMAKKNALGNYTSYGEYIIINHHDGTMTLYAHMLAGSRTVSENQTVKQGQVIGIVGSTGNSTGNHLHFEVRTLANSYRAVNPLPYLP